MKGVDDVFYGLILLEGFESYKTDLDKINEFKQKDEQLRYIEEKKQALAAYMILDRALEQLQVLQDVNTRLNEKLEYQKRKIQSLETQLENVKRKREMEGHNLTSLPAIRA